MPLALAVCCLQQHQPLELQAIIQLPQQELPCQPKHRAGWYLTVISSTRLRKAMGATLVMLHGITPDQFIKYKPAVISGLWPDYFVCIGVAERSQR